MCIGQDPVLVTPLQIAVLTSAIANGGKVLWPRLVDRSRAAGPIRVGSAAWSFRAAACAMTWGRASAAGDPARSHAG